jgi:hypothetical protein
MCSDFGSPGIGAGVGAEPSGEVCAAKVLELDSAVCELPAAAIAGIIARQIVAATNPSEEEPCFIYLL